VIEGVGQPLKLRVFEVSEQLDKIDFIREPGKASAQDVGGFLKLAKPLM
jgi:hypothetical protein